MRTADTTGEYDRIFEQLKRLFAKGATVSDIEHFFNQLSLDDCDGLLDLFRKEPALLPDSIRDKLIVVLRSLRDIKLTVLART